MAPYSTLTSGKLNGSAFLTSQILAAVRALMEDRGRDPGADSVVEHYGPTMLAGFALCAR